MATAFQDAVSKLKEDLSIQLHANRDMQDAFTQAYCKTAQEFFPDKNVVVVRGDFEVHNFEGFVEGFPSTEFLQVSRDSTVIYSCYIFDSGNLVKRGDGGFRNWCVMGNFNRHSEGGAELVDFSPIQRDVVDGTVEVHGWTEIPRQPTRLHPDGVYFVDCKRGSDPNTEYSSGIAYYKNLKDGGNAGELPDDYVDVVKGQNQQWEVSGQAKFNNGTKFYWTMFSDAVNASDFAYVGNADNTYNRYRIFKDKKHLLYTVDGWECYSVYWAY